MVVIAGMLPYKVAAGSIEIALTLLRISAICVRLEERTTSSKTSSLIQIISLTHELGMPLARNPDLTNWKEPFKSPFILKLHKSGEWSALPSQ